MSLFDLDEEEKALLAFEATQENEPEDPLDSEDQEWVERLREQYAYQTGQAPAGYRPATGLRHGRKVA